MSFGGRFTVRDVLGQGAQKCVYLVWDSLEQRNYALSLIQGPVETDEVERLLRECEALDRLPPHPHLVRLISTGTQDGLPFLVSDYVEGGDLRAALKGGPLAVDDALDIAQALASALTTAHSVGVVHRDIKPANVWFTVDREVKLGDFGLALLQDRSHLTIAGTMLGTASYMPPEQALGQPATVSSDLYALGCVLYEMLTGRPPFVGEDTLSVVSQHIHAAPVAPSWFNNEVPHSVDALVLNLLAKSMERRPRSADEFIEALRAARQVGWDDVSAVQGAEPDLQALAWGAFAGREEEMERLKSAYSGAVAGAGSTIMIVGEPGIGKTRLADEFAVFATLCGGVTLRGKCIEGELGGPFGGVIDALGSFVSECPQDELEESVGTDAGLLSAVLPGVLQRIPGTRPIRPEGEEGRRALIHALVAFVSRASTRRPIVLMVDDLHWGDRATLLFLKELAAHAPTARIMLVGLYRDVELARSHPLSGVASDLRRDKLSQRLVLRGLSLESLTDWLALVQEAGGGVTRGTFAQALFRETEGNPFFVREVLSYLVEEQKLYRRDRRWNVVSDSLSSLGVPEGVRDVIGGRLARLSDSCGHLLSRICALPGGLNWDELCAITREDDDTLLDLVEEALAAQLLVERRLQATTAYEFTHALIRQTLYEEINPTRRTLLHRQIAQSLERLYEHETETNALTLAYHFVRGASAGHTQKAIHYSREAARLAGAAFAHEDAATHFDHALEVLQLEGQQSDSLRAELLLGKGESLWNSGQIEAGREYIDSAAILAMETGATELFARSAIALGGKMFIGYFAGAREVQLLEDALALVDETKPALRSQLLARISLALRDADNDEGRDTVSDEVWNDRFIKRSRQAADEAVALAHQQSDPLVTAYALHASHLVRSTSPDLLARLSMADEMLSLAQESGDIMLEHSAQAWRVYDLLAEGRLDAATEAIDDYIRVADQLGMPQKRYFAARLRVLLPTLRGDWKVAEELAVESLKAGRSHASEAAVSSFGWQMFLIRWGQGRLGEMQAGLQQMLSGAAQDIGTYALLAVIASELGDEELLRTSWRWLDAAPIENFVGYPGIPTLCSIGCAAVGDRDRAASLRRTLAPYRGQLVIVGLMPPDGCYGAYSHYLGLLEATLGDANSAQESFEEALGLYNRAGAEPWRARGSIDYARLLLSSGGTAEKRHAASLLTDAEALASRLDMRTVAEQAQKLRLVLREATE